MQQMSDVQHHKRDEEFERAEESRRARDGGVMLIDSRTGSFVTDERDKEIARLKAALAQAGAKSEQRGELLRDIWTSIDHASPLQIGLQGDPANAVTAIAEERDELREFRTAVSTALSLSGPDDGHEEIGMIVWVRDRLTQAEAKIEQLEDGFTHDCMLSGNRSMSKMVELLAQAEQALRAVEFTVAPGQMEFLSCPWCGYSVTREMVRLRKSLEVGHFEHCLRQAALRAIAGEPAQTDQ